MNTKTPDSDKNKVPQLIRSDQWTIAERTENQISAVCLKNKQDDMILQLKQQIVQQNQKIDQQKIDELNDLLNLQNDIIAELRNRIETQERIGRFQLECLQRDGHGRHVCAMCSSKFHENRIPFLMESESECYHA